MTKSLSHYKDPKELLEVIHRRLRENRGGLGLWAAIDAMSRLDKNEKAKKAGDSNGSQQ